MNSKELKQARVQLFRDTANFKKTDRIPHFANVVTWKVFDAGYTLDQATMPTAMNDFIYCIENIHAYAPEVKVTGAISNISFEMPARKYVNASCMAYAMAAGLNCAILDPTSADMMGTVYACDALRMVDKGGRKYNRAYRKGLLGKK